MSEIVCVTPGLLTASLMASALPVFALGCVVAHIFGRLGFSQVVTFMTSMPLLLLVWYYLTGRLIDRWREKRVRRT